MDQIEEGQITLEQYLFGSSEDRSMLLGYLIHGLRLDYVPFCDQYTMPARETPRFLEGHPKRLLSLGDLVDIHSANFQSLLEHRYIYHLRSQLNALRPDDPDKGTWLLRLADVLSRRFWQLDQKDDLEEAIWYYEEALSLLPQTHYHFLEAILGFCSCVYQRFQLLGHLDDLKKLLEHLHIEQNLNLESLIAPVKFQLQSRPQLTHKLSAKELSLVVPKASSEIDAETKWAEETGSQISEQGRQSGSSPPGIGPSNSFGGSHVALMIAAARQQFLQQRRHTMMQGRPTPQGGPQLQQAPLPVLSNNLAMAHAESLIAKYMHEYTTSSTFYVIYCMHESS